eukprot:UN03966
MVFWPHSADSRIIEENRQHFNLEIPPLFIYGNPRTAKIIWLKTYRVLSPGYSVDSNYLEKVDNQLKETFDDTLNNFLIPDGSINIKDELGLKII